MRVRALDKYLIILVKKVLPSYGQAGPVVARLETKRNLDVRHEVFEVFEVRFKVSHR